MALTRKFLSAMGIEDEKIDEIINAHTETVNGLKDEAEKYKADAKKLPSIQKELDEVKEAMANGDRSPYKVKYEALVEEKAELQKQFDEYKADVDAKESHAKKADAYKQLLKDAGVSEKRIDSIIKVSDVNHVEFDKDGKVKNANELTETIKSEWADFIITKTEQGANVSNPPANNGTGKKTKEEIFAIKDTAERQRVMLENKELFI